MRLISSDVVGETGTADLRLTSYNNSSVPAVLIRRARGTEATPTTVTNGVAIGILEFESYNG